ncbi:MAG: DUF5698 domain-containing protein [Eubacteriales bacterium]|nr:DUF5698 domain-containing protein [Eubacteriales bacterium]
MPWHYLIILFVKIFEVSLGTVRIVLITKGERGKGAILGVIEVIIWLSLVSTVLSNITDDPMKGVIYAVGFGLGNFLGSIVEEKLALGTTRIEIIVLQEHEAELTNALREAGFAVTVISGQGKDYERKILVSIVQRKMVKKYVEIAKSKQKNAMITVSDSKPVYGGFGIRK